MRATGRIALLALGAAALTLGGETAKAQAVDSLQELNNRAVAASPRAKEKFPWLRGSVPVPREKGKTVMAYVADNRAVLAAPRTQEEFPELRPMARPRAGTFESDELAAIRANAALAVNPRMLELYPALARDMAASARVDAFTFVGSRSAPLR